jgi:23S rRNA pseudouridine2604 synthase
MGSQRINKFLVDLGLCSRREADRWIEAGRVFIGDRPAKLGDQVSDTDAVFVDGKLLDRSQKPRPLWIAYYKPIGLECTGNRDVPESIFRHVEFPDRVVYVGRLDKNSSGLLLMTNQTDFVNLMLRSMYGHEKEYLVTVNRPITDNELRELSQGVDLMDGMDPTLPCEVQRLAPDHFKMILKEGRNRQIRRMIEALGMRVSALKRVRFLTIRLDKLKPGEWRELAAEDVQRLMGAINKGKTRVADLIAGDENSFES